jgi:hypothetical protein
MITPSETPDLLILVQEVRRYIAIRQAKPNAMTCVVVWSVVVTHSVRNVTQATNGISHFPRPLRSTRHVEE